MCEKGRFFSYKEKKLDIEVLRERFKTLQTTTQGLMHTILLGKDCDIVTPLNTSDDDWSYSVRGYTWFDYLKVGELEDCVFKDYMQTQDIHEFLPESRNILRWKIPKLRNILAQCDLLTKNLALLCFFVSGSLAQVAEFVDFSVRNVVKSRSVLHLRTNSESSETSDIPYSFTPILFRFLISLSDPVIFLSPLVLLLFIPASLSVRPFLTCYVDSTSCPCDRSSPRTPYPLLLPNSDTRSRSTP